MTLADGTSILTVDATDWENAGWRVQLHGDLVKSADICVLIPQAIDGSPAISNGACTHRERPRDARFAARLYAPRSVNIASSTSTARGTAAS